MFATPYTPAFVKTVIYGNVRLVYFQVQLGQSHLRVKVVDYYGGKVYLKPCFLSVSPN